MKQQAGAKKLGIGAGMLMRVILMQLLGRVSRQQRGAKVLLVSHVCVL
jgi:hypothetical protein